MNNTAQQQGKERRRARGLVVFGTFSGLAVMLAVSAGADDRLTAFGLTFVTASALLAAPQLLTSLVPSRIEDMLARPIFDRFARLMIRGWGFILALQLALIIGGWTVADLSDHDVLGWVMIALGIFLLAVLVVASGLIWATVRQLDDNDRPVDQVSFHVEWLEGWLGPNWVWIVAGALFIVGTLLQFIATV